MRRLVAPPVAFALRLGAARVSAAERFASSAGVASRPKRLTAEARSQPGGAWCAEEWADSCPGLPKQGQSARQPYAKLTPLAWREAEQNGACAVVSTSSSSLVTIGQDRLPQVKMETYGDVARLESLVSGLHRLPDVQLSLVQYKMREGLGID